MPRLISLQDRPPPTLEGGHYEPQRHDQEEGEGQEQLYERAEELAALNTKLSTALEILDRRERFIIERRLLDDEGMSLAAIGRRLGVSRERARQLEARAKKKLRAQLAEFAPSAAA